MCMHPIIPIYCGIHTKHQKIIVYRGSSRDHQFQGGLSRHLHYYSIDFGPHRYIVGFFGPNSANARVYVKIELS